MCAPRLSIGGQRLLWRRAATASFSYFCPEKLPCQIYACSEFLLPHIRIPAAVHVPEPVPSAWFARKPEDALPLVHR